MRKICFYATDESGRVMPFEQTEESECLTAKLAQTEFSQASSLNITCDGFCARAGDLGYYLLPESRDTPGSMVTYFKERPNSELRVKEVSVCCFAVGLAEATYVVLPERYYSMSFYAACVNGAYQIGIHVDFEKQPAADDLILKVMRLPAGSDYNAVAKAIREDRLALGEIVPLKEKMKARETLAYSQKYPMIRVRMGWKPVPTPISHQTKENEPTMHVACSFARIRDLADELKRQGVEGATICLVGWNQKGHDGRWPQIFPVEEALGGEEELKRTIQYVQALGYAIVCHTNCKDHYEIADIFDADRLAIRKNGEAVQEGSWGGGLAYCACPVHQHALAKELLPKVRQLGFQGMHYIDVLSIVHPDACFSEKHPCSMREGYAYMREIMKMTTELFGGFSSEGSMDFTLGDLDYSLYNRFRAFGGSLPGDRFADIYIPFWELIYHGITLYNPCAETINYPIKQANAAVTYALLDGVPSFYFYSKFCGEGKSNWMGETDFLCDTAEQLAHSVSMIKGAWDEYNRFADRHLVYMESYEELENGLRVVQYEDGSCTVGNYSDFEQAYESHVIPPHSYRSIEKIANN